ncbi:dual specificity protein phosphatase 4 [Corythoichthys intestinalis]|uniref:dual specificity protein phosphatase 4 n=1 Tax=Corythoichthys intestinalis TaxID=161448 RepID=UPI0025A641EB|nr:dual specificity protein phosphatase 4 [Corythoichthys intestinalis]XP_061800337.1 dual specificity protein phosphatase 4-like [Nerophis lumbriciformis]
MEDLREMDCPVLKRLLKEDGARCLLLDCRSFLAFSAGHIRGAVNARCNTIVRRRAKGSVLSLDQVLAGDDEVRARLRSGMYSAVVLYDERTPDADAVKDDSTSSLVLHALCGDSTATHIYFLKGGYDRFFSEYPEFCLKTKSLPPLTSQSSVDSSCSSCGTPHHDQGGPVEILPFLYLGSAVHASKKEVLDAIGISALLNVSSDCPNHFEGAYQYKCIPVEDNHKEDISCWFLEAIEFIDSVRDSSGRVLVHCQAGISRSATICLAYLMKRKRVRLDEAFEFVRRRRSIISPNFSFMGQLLQFESQLLATSCAAEAAATASPLLAPKTSSGVSSAAATPTSPFIFNFPVSVVNPAYLHHSPLTTSPGC